MESLLKFSMIISLVGIVLLLFLAQFLTPKTISLNELNNQNLNEKITFDANISQVRIASPGFILLTLKQDNVTITGTLNAREFNFNSSSSYKITGRVQEYNKTLQINIDKIEKI